MTYTGTGTIAQLFLKNKKKVMVLKAFLKPIKDAKVNADAMKLQIASSMWEI
jgi:hypothetical protein